MAGTTESKLEYLIRSKEDVRLAINRMLVPCPEDTPFLEYGPKIKQVDVDLSDATVTSDDVMEGVIAYDSKEQRLVGTIPDLGPLNFEPSDEEYTIPYGRTDGGKVNKADITKLAEYEACLRIANSVDNLEDYSNTTATAEDIREGKTAYSNGERLVGTMGNNNALFETSFDSATFTTDNCSFSNLFLDTIDLRNINTDAITSWQYAFWNYKNLRKVIGFKPTKTGSLYWCFSGCRNLEEFPISEGGEFITHIGYLVSQCQKLKTINWFETKNVTDMNYMCTGCTELVEFPLLNTQSVRIGGLTDMLKNCPNLSDESLNNVMMMCVNATKHQNAAVSYKRLSYLGLSSEQITRCQSLSNCQAFLNAGWTLS